MVEKNEVFLKSSTSNNFPYSIFRAYDIRGIINDELTYDIVYDIGVALGTLAIEKGENNIVVGRDGRKSGKNFVESLTSGIISTSCNVIDIGQVATPMLYYATLKFSKGSGVMVTGSHNPKNYNGLKMMIKGETLSEDLIQNLQNNILKGNVKQFSNKNKYGKCKDELITEDYKNIINKSTKINKSKKLKIVIDAGNGIAGAFAPDIYRSLSKNFEIVELFCDVDGNFPNHHPDPSKPKNLEDLINKVKEEKADIGLAFDGDGDRLGVITNKGEMIYPDRQLMLYAKEILKERKSGTILFDVKCTKDLDGFIKKYNGTPIMYKTGHALIKKKMKEIDNILLAGEMSGHTFFKDKWFGFDDGIYTGARLLEILSFSNKTIDEIFLEIPKNITTPEININIDEDKKFQIVKELVLKSETKFKGEKIIKIDGVRVEFKNGWGLVRASNTTPCLALRFEANNKEELNKIQNLMVDWVNDTIRNYKKNN